MNTESDLLQLTASVAAAYLGTNTVDPSSIDQVMRAIHDGLARVTEPEQRQFVPAVDPRKSIKRDHLISLIDGTKCKMLKRHLTGHGLTPAEYRERYGLRSDYPMVAPAYAEKRRELALKIGLGHSRTQRRSTKRKAA